MNIKFVGVLIAEWAVCCLVGYGLVCLLLPRRWQRERLLLMPVFGAGGIILLSSFMSYAGAGMRMAAPVVFVSGVVFSVLAYISNRRDSRSFLGWPAAVYANSLGLVVGVAALDIATGQILTCCKNRHRHQEYLQFLKQVDANVSPDLGIHLVVDNYSTHKHPKVKRWLAVHPRYQIHYTPTYASWLNQVEIWFNLITQRAIRRGTFKSVKELIAKIEQSVNQYNRNSRPFVWTATADSILEKIKRLCQRISETRH